MASSEGIQEVVAVFDNSGSKIDLEMRFGRFNSLLAQKGTLPSHAASVVKAVYAQVGPGLAVAAAVFFQFKVNEQGYLDPAFNLPLEYMADNAGEGPDLGHGPINVACRSQCPVPWHAINLWEPSGAGKRHPAMLLQRAVSANELGLKVVPAVERRHASNGSRGVVIISERPLMPLEASSQPVQVSEVARPLQAGEEDTPATAKRQRRPRPRVRLRAPPRRKPVREPHPKPASREEAAARSPTPADAGPKRAPERPAAINGGSDADRATQARKTQPLQEPETSPATARAATRALVAGTQAMVASTQAKVQAQVQAKIQAMQEKLTATFGEAGRLDVGQYARQHREQLGQVADQFRAEMHRQQQGYLEQIKSCREEIQQLKAALRHEQKRNQRLQELLRGGV